MNIVVISGNLTREPEYLQTKAGANVLKFGMAVNDRRRNPTTGQWEERANYVDVVMFGKRTEWLSKNLRKGTKVIVDGKLSYSSWDDKQTGRKRSKIEVMANDVELPPRRSDSDSQPQQVSYGQQPNNYTSNQQYGPQNGYQGFSGGYQNQPEMDVYESDIPFGG